MEIAKFSNSAENVMLCTLTHNGLLHAEMSLAFNQASAKRNVFLKAVPTSLLAAGYNQVWCEALNNRERMGWRYLAILHADIVPEIGWLDKLIDLADLHKADLMSAIVPIKDGYGVTSTAISRDNDRYSCFARLTQTQVNDPAMPSTFDISALHRANAQPINAEKLKAPLNLSPDARLLVNTGCCVFRIDREWSSSIYFTINDRIVGKVGSLYNEVEPEDWFVSRLFDDYGGRVFATREVKLKHVGQMEYDSRLVWGKAYDEKSLML